MTPRQYAPVDSRQPNTSVQDLRRLHSHVKRRRPKAKIQRPPEYYYQTLIEQHDAVLGHPSADSVLRMLTHISLMRDPRALVHIPNDVLAALPPDSDITALEQERDKLKARSYRVQGTDTKAEARRLIAAIGSARSQH